VVFPCSPIKRTLRDRSHENQPQKSTTKRERSTAKRARGDAFPRAFRLALLCSFIFLVADNRCSTVVVARRNSVEKNIPRRFSRFRSQAAAKEGTEIIQGRVKLFPTIRAKRPTFALDISLK